MQRSEGLFFHQQGLEVLEVMDEQVLHLPLALQSQSWREWRDLVEAPDTAPGSVSRDRSAQLSFYSH